MIAQALLVALVATAASALKFDPSILNQLGSSLLRCQNGQTFEFDCNKCTCVKGEWMCSLESCGYAKIDPNKFIHTNEAHATEEEDFDFVVVGAGSTGAAVANRLSANGTFRVLLLEKGGEAMILSAVPAMAAVMYTTKNADLYYLERQPNIATGLRNQTVVWVKGQGLGGTSLMNYMVMTRGDREYYDRWAKTNPGWAWNDVEPFFMAIENARKIPGVNTTLRGTNGEVDIVENESRTPVVDAFIDGCKSLGMNYLKDYNAEEMYGVGYVQANIRDGTRCQSEKAFIRDIRYTRSNFVVKTHAMVTKLMINKDTKVVEKLQYRMGERTYTVKINKEVILSAGTMASPQILMLSGIGPKKHLEEMGIEVIKDLPVGQAIYDHVIYPGLVFKINASVTPSFHDMVDPENWIQYLLSRKGPLTVPGFIIEALGFIKTPICNETKNYSDVEYIFMSGSFNTDHGMFMKNEWNVACGAFEAIFEPLLGTHVWSVWPMLFRPESRGYMKLRSTDPMEKPRFWGNYFTDPNGNDMKTMIAAIRMAQRIAKTPAMAKFQSEIVLSPLPGCETKESDSDAFWECQIRSIATGVWHETSSCRMGPKDDPEAVVDHELKVHGMKNLRVADLSIFPTPFQGHPNVPAMMIGTKAAAMVLKDHQK